MCLIFFIILHKYEYFMKIYPSRFWKLNNHPFFFHVTLIYTGFVRDDASLINHEFYYVLNNEHMSNICILYT